MAKSDRSPSRISDKRLERYGDPDLKKRRDFWRLQVPYQIREVTRFGEYRRRENEFRLSHHTRSPQVCAHNPGIPLEFRHSTNQRERLFGGQWRRERNWNPTFSRSIANDFAALRSIHLKAQNGSANAAPIIIDEQFSIFFMERPGRERVE
jgi:hypothetical protein